MVKTYPADGGFDILYIGDSHIVRRFEGIKKLRRDVVDGGIFTSRGEDRHYQKMPRVSVPDKPAFDLGIESFELFYYIFGFLFSCQR